MTAFTQEQIQSLQEKASASLQQLHDGIPAREIMAQIYQSGLEEKTIEQSRLMADDALRALTQFHQEYRHAQENMGDYLNHFAEQVTKGKTLAERCTIWYQLYASLSEIEQKASGVIDLRTEATIQEAEKKVFSEEDATPEIEESFRKKALETLQNSSLLCGVLQHQADRLEDISSDQIPNMVVQWGKDQLDCEGILTMLAYVEIKNGTMPHMPADMTLEQTAQSVAASMEQIRIAEQVSSGKMSSDTAVQLLRALGCVVLVGLTAAVLLWAGKSILMIGTFLPTLALPFYALGAVGAFLAFLGIVLEGAWKAEEFWESASEKIAQILEKPLSAAVEVLSTGFQAVSAFFQETVAPTVADTVEKASQEMSAWLNHNKNTKAGPVDFVAPVENLKQD